MATTLSDKLTRLDPERRARIEAEAARLNGETLTLAELRRARAVTQAERAEALGVRQATVAQMERRSDLLPSMRRGTIEGHERRAPPRGGVSGAPAGHALRLRRGGGAAVGREARPAAEPAGD